MKIYFAGSIRGGRDDASLYTKLIKHLKKYGEVLTEHVGDKKLSQLGEDGDNDKKIHDRDLEWLKSSDVVVADVSIPSLGVGYEIAKAAQHNKKILCLYRKQDGKRLSGMISGCPDAFIEEYETEDEAKEIIDKFMESNQ